MRRSCLPLLAVLAGLPVPSAWADVPPPPRVEVYLDNLGEYPDYAFFFFPFPAELDPSEGGAFRRVIAETPTWFDQSRDKVPPAAKLYAVKGPRPQKRNDPIFSDPTVPRSRLDLRFLTVFREGGQQTYHYRIAAIEAGVIKLELVSKGFSPMEYHRYDPRNPPSH